MTISPGYRYLYPENGMPTDYVQRLRCHRAGGLSEGRAVLMKLPHGDVC